MNGMVCTNYFTELLSSNVFNTSGMCSIPSQYQIGLSSTEPTLDGENITEPSDIIEYSDNLWDLSTFKNINDGLISHVEYDNLECVTQNNSVKEWSNILLIDNFSAHGVYSISCSIFNSYDIYLYFEYTDGTIDKTEAGLKSEWKDVFLLSDESKIIKSIGISCSNVFSNNKSYIDISTINIVKLDITHTGYQRITVDNDSDYFSYNGEKSCNTDKLYFPESLIPWDNIQYYLILDNNGNLLMFGKLTQVLDIPMRTIIAIPKEFLGIKIVNGGSL